VAAADARRGLGILGGSFDPPHLGHLHLALACRSRLGLAEVRLMPTGRLPPHRPPAATEAADRVAMTKAAVAGHDGLGVDLREQARSGPCYTVDSLLELRAEAPRRPLWLLLGADALHTLPTWRAWQRILELANLAVALRPGSPAGNWPAAVAARLYPCRPDTPLPAEANGHVVLLDVHAHDVSSSQLRRRLAGGADTGAWITPPVLDYIARHGLYHQPAVQRAC